MSQALIEKAIKNKQKLSFIYHAQQRIIDPQILGFSSGKLQLLAWQTGGVSSSGGLPDWRRFEVPNMFKVMILEQTFLPQPKGNRDASFDIIVLIAQ